MKRHLLIIYWLVLLVSTLAIGMVAFRLLDIERKNDIKTAEDVALQEGANIAEKMNFLVTTTKQTTFEELRKFHDASLEHDLEAWLKNNPYAQGAFVYRPDKDTPDKDVLKVFDRTPGHNELTSLLRINNTWIWTPRGNSQAQNRFVTLTGPNNLQPTPDPVLENLPQNIRDNLPSTPPPADNASPYQTVVDAIKKSVNITINNSISSQNTSPITGNLIDAVNAVQQPIIVQNANPDFSSGVNGGFITINGGPVIPEHTEKWHRLNMDVLSMNYTLTVNSTLHIYDDTRPSNDGTFRMQDYVANVSFTENGSYPNSSDGNWVLLGGDKDPRWVAWQNPPGSGNVIRGVELDWDSLGESMGDLVPKNLASGEGFVLRNPAGSVIVSRFANGKLNIPGDKSLLAVSDAPNPAALPIDEIKVGLEMPNWTLSVYFLPSSSFSSGFVTVSTILVAILVFSILLGGTLLLNQARRESLDAIRKTTFVSNVSHELKTPLTTIRMYAELLDNDRIRDDSKRRTYLSTIISESQRLTRLVNNVLDLNRLDQGRKKYTSSTEPLSELVARIAETQRPRLEAVGIALETRVPDNDSVLVNADRDAVEQVLLNLMDNAMKYAADGRWLGVSVQRNGTFAILTVADHGPGVPASQRKRIFDMFHRVDDTLTAKQPGSGLGLSIARRLLRDQEGDLVCEPNQPNGAKFVATIPLAETPADTADRN